MAVNNVSGNIPAGNANPAPNARAEAPRPRHNAANLFANDAWFAADDDFPTVGDPVGNGGHVGDRPTVDRNGEAPGGRVVGGSAANAMDDDLDGRGGFGRFFHRIFSGSGSGS